MNPDPNLALRLAFHERRPPEKWLRDSLHPMDAEDGIEFIDDIKKGGSPEKYFRSSIPYDLFLTPEAATFLLPDYFASIVSDSTQIISVLCYLEDNQGQLVLAGLHEKEKIALISFIEDIQKRDEMLWMLDNLLAIKEIIQKTPNQALQTTIMAVTDSAAQTPRQP